MISFLIWIVILLLIFGVLFYVIDMLPFIEPPFKNVAKALLALVFVIILLGALMGAVPMPAFRGFN